MSAEPKRTRGGQPGNKNAVKHGLYTRHFTSEERQRFENGRLDLLDEIGVARVAINRILAGLETETDLSNESLKALQTLLNAIITLGTTMRSHTFLTGGNRDLDEAAEEALDLEEKYWELA